MLRRSGPRVHLRPSALFAWLLVSASFLALAPDAAGQDRAAGTPLFRQWIAAAARLDATGLREDSDSAVLMLRRVITAEPANLYALEQLALLHAARVRRYGLPVSWYDTAAILTARITRQRPAHGHYVLGRVHAMRGEDRMAEEALRRALRDDSTHILARLWLANQLLMDGRPHLAIPFALRAADVMPQGTMPRDIAGMAYLQLEQPDLAELQFRKSLALRPTAPSMGGLLLTRLLRRDYAAAIGLTADFLQRDTASAALWTLVGEAYFFAGSEGEAVRVLNGALQRDANVTLAYLAMSAALPVAFVHSRSRRPEEVAPLVAHSYAHADSLMKSEQPPWNAYYQYAALALIEGQRDRALRWLRAAHQAGMPGPLLIETDPLFGELRTDPQFQEVVQQLRWRQAEFRRLAGLRG